MRGHHWAAVSLAMVAVALPSCLAAEGSAPSAAEAEAEGSVLSAGDARTFEGIEFVWIPPGKFTMGSPPEEAYREENEGPQHEVTISKGFWLGVYEVTAGQFLEFLKATGKDSSVEFGEYCPLKKSKSGYSLSGNEWGSDEKQPMVMLSRPGVVAFCEWLSSKGEGKYRLPTEAEWEYACRAGTTTAFSFGEASAPLGDYGWHDQNSDKVTHPAGLKKPNPWGLYAMHGNVLEWCSDWYAERYPAEAATDPKGPSSGELYVVRGGFFYGDWTASRSANRWSMPEDVSHTIIGFRVAREGDGTGGADTTEVPTPEPPVKERLVPESEEVTPHAGTQRTLLGIEFVWIPPGTFMMGSPWDEDGRDDDERQHQVTLSKGFWLGVYEVTIGQYLSFLEAGGSDSGVDWDDPEGDCPIEKNESSYGLSGNRFGSDADQPMIEVSWDGAVAFCEWLTSKRQGTYRLPTEAEWEYACRAGTTTPFSFGADESGLGDYAWYDDNGGDVTHAVGGKKPNPWGLCDMHGNVWEWCADWHDDSYPGGAVTDPAGPSSGRYRVARGGSWGTTWHFRRSADRAHDFPEDTGIDIGFRVVREGD